MSMRKTLLFLAFTAAVGSAGAAETSSGAFLAQTRAIWERRADPAAIVSIYRAEVLLDAEDGPGALETVLAKVSVAPDADPEVRAHAAIRLAALYRDEGRVEEASRLEESLGFVRAWRVVGPFDDENKDGFDTAFPPEAQMAWDGTYEGKGHQVAWRALPAPAEAGLVPLDQVLTPSEKTAGYAAAFVRVLMFRAVPVPASARSTSRAAVAASAGSERPALSAASATAKRASGRSG